MTGRNLPPQQPFTEPPLLKEPVPMSRWQTEALSELKQLVTANSLPLPGKLLQCLRNLDDDALQVAGMDTLRYATDGKRFELFRDAIRAELGLRIEQHTRERHGAVLAATESLRQAILDAGRSADNLVKTGNRLALAGIVVAVVLGLAQLGVAYLQSRPPVSSAVTHEGAP